MTPQHELLTIGGTVLAAWIALCVLSYCLRAGKRTVSRPRYSNEVLAALSKRHIGDAPE